MNRALGHFCAHTGHIGPREPHEDGEMSAMTLPSRHRILNLKPGVLRPSTLLLGHEGFLRVDGEETFLFSFKPPTPWFANEHNCRQNTSYYLTQGLF